MDFELILKNIETLDNVNLTDAMLDFINSIEIVEMILIEN